MNYSGLLYAIGVGPGDPDLMTLAALKALAQVDVVFAAASSKNEHSLSLDIARPHLKAWAETVILGFPMTRDQQALETAWSANTAQVLEALSQGKRAAFLTLGDPLTYSTFGYLMRGLKAAGAGTALRIIPGITSYQAAAAASASVLCEGDENLMIVSGIAEPECLKKSLQAADNAVILKTYRNFPRIRQVLDELGLADKTRMLSHCGLEGESRHFGLEDCPEKPPYLSLILLKKGGG